MRKRNKSKSFEGGSENGLLLSFLSRFFSCWAFELSLPRRKEEKREEAMGSDAYENTYFYNLKNSINYEMKWNIS